MQKQEEEEERQQVQEQRHKPGNKFCDCAHTPDEHDALTGQCKAIIEGKDCEDHWQCPCICVICVHVIAYPVSRSGSGSRNGNGNGKGNVTPRTTATRRTRNKASS